MRGKVGKPSYLTRSESSCVSASTHSCVVCEQHGEKLVKSRHLGRQSCYNRLELEASPRPRSPSRRAVMHQTTGSKPLGERHVRRLRQLREANDEHIQRLHLSRATDESRVRLSSEKELSSSAKRTVEDVIEARKNPSSTVSNATRLRDTISASRGGIQTERSDRSTGEPHPYLLPALRDNKHAINTSDGGGVGRQKLTVRSIASVRRRKAFQSDVICQGVTRMGKKEAEWVEKQMLFTQRVAALEKDCLAAWRAFYSGSSTTKSTSPSQSPSLINKTLEEIGMARTQDSRVLMQQLGVLRQKATRISAKVNSMRDGAQFFSELEEMIEDMETSLSMFRSAQLKTYEKYVLEENVLEKELGSFLEKLEDWERDDQEHFSISERVSSRMRGRLRESSAAIVDNNAAANDMDAPRNTDDDFVKQVRNLNNAIMQSGGMKGGWDERDHAIFTAELSKCGLTDRVLLRHNSTVIAGNNSSRELQSNQLAESHEPNDNVDYEALVAKFMRKCTTKIVTKTTDAIRRHFDWYIGHAKLVDEKKRIVADWKLQKEEQRRDLLSGAEDFNPSSDHFDHDRCSPGNSSAERKSSKNEGVKSVEDKVVRDQEIQAWKEQKVQREMELEREQIKLQEEREAKRRQAHLESKQKLLLYKMQKEEEALTFGSSSANQPSTPSPPRKEELMERSRQAIDFAKARRAQLEAMEARRQNQAALPPRPKSAKRLVEESLRAKEAVALYQATESFKARALSKEELRRKSRERKRQSAHDKYIPGSDAIPDVKVKSFGHIPIQPRAIPAWRKQL